MGYTQQSCKFFCILAVRIVACGRRSLTKQLSLHTSLLPPSTRRWTACVHRGRSEEIVAFHGVNFITVADGLLHVSEMGEAELETNAPKVFVADAFDVYLTALGTEGHGYYASPLEILAVAAAADASVVIARPDPCASCYDVIGSHLCCPGEIAILVLRCARRGHFERLCTLDIVVGAETIVAEAARCRREEEERRRQKERERKKMHVEEHELRNNGGGGGRCGSACSCSGAKYAIGQRTPRSCDTPATQLQRSNGRSCQ